MKKLILIISGTVLLLLGLFLTLMTAVYSLKEGDKEIYKYLSFSVIIVLLSVYIIMKGIKTNKPQLTNRTEHQSDKKTITPTNEPL